MLFPNWGGVKPPDLLKVNIQTGEIVVNSMSNKYWDNPENCMLQRTGKKNADCKHTGPEPAKP